MGQKKRDSMFATYVDERDFALSHVTNVTSYVRLSVHCLSPHPVCQMRNRQLLLDKSNDATKWLCFVFGSVLF